MILDLGILNPTLIVSVCIHDILACYVHIINSSNYLFICYSEGVADDNITQELRPGKPGWQAHLKVAYACKRHGFQTSPSSLTRIIKKDNGDHPAFKASTLMSAMWMFSRRKFPHVRSHI